MNMDEELERRFTYHPLMDVKLEHYYRRIRFKAKMLAAYINANCPESREKYLAFTKLEEAVMWANAALARNQEGSDNGKQS